MIAPSLAAAIGLAAALLQLGAVPALFAGAAAPLLPIALLAGWTAVRGGGEVWPVTLIAAVAFGAVSEQQAGWYVVAFIPALALTATITGSPLRRTSVMLAAAVAGTVAYFAILTAGEGEAGLLLRASLTAGGWTAVLALLTAVAVLPFRRRPDAGLFA